MPCYHPNYAVQPYPGAQPKFLIGRFNSNITEVLYHGQMLPLLKLPCGQCIGCRLEYSREWADRCTMETITTPANQSWFVTLTYDDDHLPSPGEDNIIGGTPYPGTLRFDDHQKWLKRFRQDLLRKHGDIHPRHYTAGEYGTIGLRPHYHTMLYNVPLHDFDGDLVAYKRNKFGDMLYTSKILTDTWQQGYVVVAPASWRTAAYTARYVLKKRRGKDSKQWYTDLGVTPESTRSSNRPGIASAYYNEHWEELYYGKSQKIILPAIDGHANITTPPRFFDEKFRKVDPERLELIKRQRREIAELAAKCRASLLHIVGSEDEYMGELEKKLLRQPNYRVDI